MKVGANIIAMYPSTSLFIAVGQLAIAILVMFSYPLQVHPCRNCLDKVFHFGQVEAKQVTESEDDEFVDDDHTHAEMSPLKHTLLTMAIVGIGFAVAFFVDDLQMGTYSAHSVFPNLVVVTDYNLDSPVVCRIYWVHYDLIYSPGPVLLAGEQLHFMIIRVLRG